MKREERTYVTELREKGLNSDLKPAPIVVPSHKRPGISTTLEEIRKDERLETYVFIDSDEYDDYEKEYSEKHIHIIPIYYTEEELNKSYKIKMAFRFMHNYVKNNIEEDYFIQMDDDLNNWAVCYLTDEEQKFDYVQTYKTDLYSYLKILTYLFSLEYDDTVFCSVQDLAYIRFRPLRKTHKKLYSRNTQLFIFNKNNLDFEYDVDMSWIDAELLFKAIDNRKKFYTYYLLSVDFDDYNTKNHKLPGGMDEAYQSGIRKIETDTFRKKYGKEFLISKDGKNIVKTRKYAKYKGLI